MSDQNQLLPVFLSKIAINLTLGKKVNIFPKMSKNDLLNPTETIY